MKKRALITGAAGFIGHHMVEHFLKNTDWDIAVVDGLNYAGNLNRLRDMDIYEKEKSRIDYIWHDLKSPISDTINSQIGDFDCLVHLAAETHVDRSLEDPVPFILSNVLGTTNLVQWIKNKHRDKKTIIFSTDEVFGPAPEGYFFKEEDVHRPSNPYAASKSGQEMISYSLAHAYNLDLMITRCMNVFGERQDPEKFVPKTIKSILKNERVILHGTSKENISSRCWIHARNVSDAILFLLEHGEKQEFYNIVGEEKTVYEIANIINNVIKKRDLRDDEIEYVDFHKARLGHDKRYALDGSKMAKLGWKSPMSIEKTLETMVNWHFKSKKNMAWL